MVECLVVKRCGATTSRCNAIGVAARWCSTNTRRSAGSDNFRAHAFNGAAADDTASVLKDRIAVPSHRVESISGGAGDLDEGTRRTNPLRLCRRRRQTTATLALESCRKALAAAGLQPRIVLSFCDRALTYFPSSATSPGAARGSTMHRFRRPCIVCTGSLRTDRADSRLRGHAKSRCLGSDVQPVSIGQMPTSCVR